MSAENGDNDSAICGKNTLSFKINSKVSSKVESVVSKQFNDKVEVQENFNNEDKDYILAAEGKELKSLKPKKDISKLVIPMIVKNKWKNSDDSVYATDDLIAAKEIVKDLTGEGNGEKDIEPILLKNRLPASKDGTVMDELYDISIRPEESSMDDYNNTPITSFGSAMLRGMGWSEGKAIGINNKGLCEPIEYIPRHKGLGLGAEKINTEPNSKKRKLGESDASKKYNLIVEKDGRVRHIKKVGEEVQAQVKGFFPGCYVKILKASHKDLYGKVISVDEDTARLSVKLSLNDEIIQLSQYNVCLVDKIPSQTQNKVNDAKCGINFMDKEDELDKKFVTPKNTNGDNSVSTWLEPYIKVRIISKSYKSGRYYNKKIKILDVTSSDRCTCQTDEGKILENVYQEYLETVVPKTKDSYIFVVGGKYKGKLAKLLDRNPSKCIATVQLTLNKHVTHVKFDYISEYVGELPDDEFL